MARLVIVSNRVSMPRERLSRAGGLAVALREALNQYGGLWFGWSGEITETPSAAPRRASAGKCEFAVHDLTPDEHHRFYIDFANSTLWPLCHYRLGLIDFHRAAFEGYYAVNERFAASLAEMLRPDDIVWVHDYHFIPMAAALRRLGVENRIGFFLHIPFPAPEVLAALPGHDRLVRDLCDYDLIGFQTKGDVRALTEYIIHEANGAVSEDGEINCYGRRARAAAFPIGIETEGFARLAASEAHSPETQRLHDSLGQRSLVIGVDRLDYSKGIPQRFDAFQIMLGARPELRGKVTFMQIAPISRGEVTQYRKLRTELDALTGRINGRFAEFDWMPLRYLNKSFPRSQLAGFYRVAKVGLVTPLRDGMNLVAKEYVAAQDPNDPGVLVLSRFAGASHEMGGAVIVNPYDPEQVAEALARALTMPVEERKQRWQYNMDVLRANTVTNWRERFLAALAEDDSSTPFRRIPLKVPS